MGVPSGTTCGSLSGDGLRFTFDRSRKGDAAIASVLRSEGRLTCRLPESSWGGGVDSWCGLCPRALSATGELSSRRMKACGEFQSALVCASEAETSELCV